MLWDLGWGLLTLGDCKDAHAELVSVRREDVFDLSDEALIKDYIYRSQEIDLARQELRAKGVDVD